MLSGCRLVVLGLGVNAECPERLVEISHVCADARLERTEVVILKLLSLRCHRTKERTSRIDQVLAAVVHFLINDKILLLCADRRHKTLAGRVAKQTENAQALRADRVDRAQKGRFCIECLSRIRAEGGGNIECAVLDEGIRGRVPSRIASGLKGRAQAARGERGRVRLTLDQLLARKLHHNLAVANGREEGIVLLCRYTRQRLEPMRIVRSTLFDRPVLHGVGHNVGHRCINRSSRGNRFGQRFIYFLRQAFSHDFIVEHHTSKQSRNVFVHFPSPLCDG